jgi:hypothetical protein
MKFKVWGTAALVVAVIVLILSTTNTRRWTRERPLQNPLKVVDVTGGVLTLEDGRRFTPAGVQLLNERDGVSVDGFLRTATLQGVEIIRDLGNGSALLLVEPKFYNWCGTSTTWAGSYLRCHLSCLLIHYRLAVHRETPLLTPRERWLLNGLEQGREYLGEPYLRLSGDKSSFRYDSSVNVFPEPESLISVFLPAPP